VVNWCAKRQKITFKGEKVPPFYKKTCTIQKKVVPLQPKWWLFNNLIEIN
jgi:hypothetical protein